MEDEDSVDTDCIVIVLFYIMLCERHMIVSGLDQNVCPRNNVALKSNAKYTPNIRLTTQSNR